MPIVTDAGFAAEGPRDWLDGEALAAGVTGEGRSVLLAPDADVAALWPRLSGVALVAVAFPAFSDGRGFGIAARLRALGFRGRLRARGHLVPDQYRHARAVGFDEVEIDDALATRQGEAAWCRQASRSAPLLSIRRAAAAARA